MGIFRHKDGDNDELEVLLNRDRLRFMAVQGHASSEVDLDRDAVLSLIQALSEWAYPTHTPEGPNRSLIEQMIGRNVREQITAILPLHLKTVAARETLARQRGCDCVEGEESDPEPQTDPYCHLSECEWGKCNPHPADCAKCEPETDPEPGDVGHPRPSPEAKGRLMKELLPRRIPGTVIACIECLHGWGEHTGGICWGTGGHDNLGNGCTCTRERPGAALLRKQMQEEAAPPPCTECGHPYLSHGDECAAMLRDDHAIKCGCTRYRSTR